MSTAPERVIYVDSTGGVHEARLLGGPDEHGRYQLLVSHHGAARLRTIAALYATSPQPSTWHRPPKPS